MAAIMKKQPDKPAADPSPAELPVQINVSLNDVLLYTKIMVLLHNPPPGLDWSFSWCWFVPSGVGTFYSVISHLICSSFPAVNLCGLFHMKQLQIKNTWFDFCRWVSSSLIQVWSQDLILEYSHWEKVISYNQNKDDVVETLQVYSQAPPLKKKNSHNDKKKFSFNENIWLRISWSITDQSINSGDSRRPVFWINLIRILVIHHIFELHQILDQLDPDWNLSGS